MQRTTTYNVPFCMHYMPIMLPFIVINLKQQTELITSQEMSLSFDSPAALNLLLYGWIVSTTVKFTRNNKAHTSLLGCNRCYSPLTSLHAPLSYQNVPLAVLIYTWSLIHEHGVYLITVSCLQFCSHTILITKEWINSKYVKTKYTFIIPFAITCTCS